ncbi:MAG TPA: hypothetical protein VFQ53_30525 [Kofleriaceae bacterium]|nr:hypothetical protein [Kofleriaceae bacterium]
MDPDRVDLLDHRPRVFRLVVAIALGVVLGLVSIAVIRRLAVAPGADPMSQASLLMTTMGLIVAWSCAVHETLAMIARRRR